jgi:hypothetical protein
MEESSGGSVRAWTPAPWPPGGHRWWISERSEDLYLAIREDIELATREDFFTAMDMMTCGW